MNSYRRTVELQNMRERDLLVLIFRELESVQRELAYLSAPRREADRLERERTEAEVIAAWRPYRIPTRALTPLVRNRIKPEQFLAMEDREFRDIRNFGQKSIDDVREALR